MTKQKDISSKNMELFDLGLFRNIVEQARDIIFVIDLHGKIIYANNVASNAYGYSIDELLKMRIHDLRSPETTQEISAQITKAYQDGTLFRTIHVRRNGETFPVEVSSRCIQFDGGSGLVSIIRDISKFVALEKTQAEKEESYQLLYENLMATHEELAASEEELRHQFDELMSKEEKIYSQNVVLSSLHETALGLMTNLDQDDVLKKIIVGATELFDTPHGFVHLVNEAKGTFTSKIGTGFFAGFTYEGKITDGLMGQAYKTGKIVAVENYSTWEHRIQDHIFDKFYYFTIVPLKDKDSTIGAFGLTFSTPGRTLSEGELFLLQRFADLAAVALSNAKLVASYKNEIQERKQTEKALRVSEEKLAKAFYISPDSIGILRAKDGLFIDVNQGFTRFNGYTRQEVIGKTSVELGLWVDPRDRVRMIAELAQRGEVFNQEICFKRKDGSIYYGLLSSRVIYLDDVECLLTVVRDITERKLAEKLQITIYRISEAAVLSGSLAEVCRSTHLIIEELIPSDNFYITLFDEHGQMTYPYRAGENTEASHLLGKCLEEYVFKTGEPLLADAIRVAELVAQCEVLSPVPPTLSWLGVPLKTADGKVLGVMATYAEDVTYTENHRETFTFVSYQVALGIERKQAEDRLKFLSLHDTLTGIYNRAHFERELARIKNSGDGSVALIVCDINGMKLVNDTLGHSAGDQLLIATAKVIQSAVRDGDVFARIGGDEFAIILPHANETLTEVVCDRIRKKITEHNKDTSNLEISLSFGYAVRNCNKLAIEELFREADDYMYREKMHHLQSVRSNMVQTAMKLLEVRDFHTEGHADRLQDLAIQLSRQLGLPKKRIADIRLFAKFHDIGKVGIPDRILLKPGFLTQEEKKEMQRHAEIGCRIAQTSSDLAPISDWILKHHEWWNGQGYPLGLKEDHIPIECRILAIVDAYDAMISNRPYRKAMPQKEAIDELCRCAGTQFDPRLVNLFISIV